MKTISIINVSLYKWHKKEGSVSTNTANCTVKPAQSRNRNDITVEYLGQ